MPDLVIRDSWRDRLDALSGRRRDIAAIGALLAVLCLIAFVVKGGRAGATIAPPATIPPNEVEASPSFAAVVHVAGAVRRPGVYEMPAGARVADAITTAGGPLAKADTDRLNLAEPLIDGIQILVPRRGDPDRAMGSAQASTTGSSGPIDVNVADVAALETIPGIGPVKAAAIVDHRDRLGPFETVEGLLDVSGIGPATLEAIRPYVSV